MSFFRIHCKELLNFLIGKYQSVQKNLKEVIANRARNISHKISSDFKEINEKLKEQPKNIESLIEIKDYMENIPGFY